MNISQLIYEKAKKHPHKIAIIAPVHHTRDGFIYSQYTYKDFVEKSNSLCVHLQKLNVKEGSKVLLFVKPSLNFSILVFSLFSMGAIPIFIDPGVGPKNLLKAIAKVQPDILVAEPIVHILKKIFRSYFSNVKLSITTQKTSFLTSQISLTNLIQNNTTDLFEYKDQEGDHTAAIIYTSGATGAPKGVVYTHAMFYAQVQLLEKTLNIKEEDKDLSCFPLFSLFSIAMGMTSVIPCMDAAKPASANPFFLLQHIQDHGISFGTGSPAIWQKLANYCIENHIKLPKMRGIMMFGAPVSLQLHEQFKIILTNGTTYTPYGATECLPVSWISGESILENYADRTLKGAGTCIGKVFENTELRIIPSSFEGLSEMPNELPPFKIGELVVCGKQTTLEYFQNPEETKKAKIFYEGKIWHRMGDVGYKDDQGMLWFCGRKAHQVITKHRIYYPIPCEAIFNQHPLVKRSALIAWKDTAAIVIERKDGRTELSSKEFAFLRGGLLALGSKFEHTKDINTFFLYRDFPVDCRHNIKIDRLLLSQYFNKRVVLYNFATQSLNPYLQS